MEKLRLHIILKQLLKERNLSMREVSRHTRIPEATLSGYANGAEPSKMQHVRALARFFQLSMEDLLYGEAEPGNLVKPHFTGWLRVKIEEVIPDKPEPMPET